MAQYVLIKDGVITNYYDSIPGVLGNEVSGFNKLTNEEREAFGFYHVEQRVAFYDPAIHTVTRDEYLIEDGKPVKILEVQDRYTSEELLEAKKQKFYSLLRDNRDSLLSGSDWAMTQDIIEMKGQTHYDAWRAYRQALRDLPEQDFSTINWEISEVVYPGSPA